MYLHSTTKQTDKTETVGLTGALKKYKLDHSTVVLHNLSTSLRQIVFFWTQAEKIYKYYYAVAYQMHTIEFRMIGLMLYDIYTPAQ